MLIESDDIPKTSQVNEYSFEECFSSLTADGSEVIAILMSSKLSGTYDSACKAASRFEGKVHVIDSLNVCIAERILIQYALRLISEGNSAGKTVEILNRRKHEIKILALLGTLKYLQKGGRLSKTGAIAGEMLNIKPVLTVDNGEVKVVGKALGSKKGNNMLDRLVDSSGGINFDMPFAVAYSGLDDSMLNKYLVDSQAHYSSSTDCVPKYQIGSTIGTHAGPGAIAVAFFCKGK